MWFKIEIVSLLFWGYIYPHLQRYVVAGLVGSAGMSDILFKLLQTVQHCLSQQLASSGCSSDTAFTRNRPQLFNTGTQPSEVTTNLLEVDREEKGIEFRDNVEEEIAIKALRNTLLSSVLPQMAVDIPAACWWRTDLAVVSYRVHPDYRPGRGSYPEHHRAPSMSLTTRVAMLPQSGPWLVAAETRKTSKQSFQNGRILLTFFCCPQTSFSNKHKIH